MLVAHGLIVVVRSLTLVCSRYYKAWRSGTWMNVVRVRR
jgi:hypothetical protein